jgi:hypothetical protein
MSEAMGSGSLTALPVIETQVLWLPVILSIPDPNSIRIRIKEKYFNPKKWFLSSRKYDPDF